MIHLNLKYVVGCVDFLVMPALKGWCRKLSAIDAHYFTQTQLNSDDYTETDSAAQRLLPQYLSVPLSLLLHFTYIPWCHKSVCLCAIDSQQQGRQGVGVDGGKH